MEEKVDIVALGKLLIDLRKQDTVRMEENCSNRIRRSFGKSSNSCKSLWVSHIFYWKSWK